MTSLSSTETARENEKTGRGFTPVDFMVEQMGETLFSLSASLKASGFLDDERNSERYEAVVTAWNGLTMVLAKAG